jgi:hypothetical protein
MTYGSKMRRKYTQCSTHVGCWVLGIRDARLHAFSETPVSMERGYLGVRLFRRQRRENARAHRHKDA